jgi:ERCC4-type nuclease
MHAPAQVLAQVDGIGKVTAKKIREVLDAEVL